MCRPLSAAVPAAVLAAPTPFPANALSPPTSSTPFTDASSNQRSTAPADSASDASSNKLADDGADAVPDGRSHARAHLSPDGRTDEMADIFANAGASAVVAGCARVC